MEVIEEEEKKAAGLFDILNDINYNKQDLFNQDEVNQKDYTPFVVNLLLSYHIDAIMMVNELNARPGLSKRAHHDFLFHKLPKRKRFSKLAKPSLSEKVALIKAVYDYSTEKALEVLSLFSEEDFEEMKRKTFRGGSGGVVKAKRGVKKK